MRPHFMINILVGALLAAGLTRGAVAQPAAGDATASGASDATASGAVTDDTRVTPPSDATDATDATGTSGATDPLGGAVAPGTPPAVTAVVKPKTEDDATPQPTDRSGQVGVGVEGTLGFRLAPSYLDASGHVLRLPALSFIYPASPLFNFQVLAGANLAFGASSPATVQLGVTLRGIYLGIILSRTVTLTIPFGLGYTVTIGPGFDQVTGTQGSVTAHFFHLETGIRPEWFITDYFSLHTQAGAVISLLTNAQATSGGASYDPGVGISLFANTNLLAQAGFTVWFK